MILVASHWPDRTPISLCRLALYSSAMQTYILAEDELKQAVISVHICRLFMWRWDTRHRMACSCLVAPHKATSMGYDLPESSCRPPQLCWHVILPTQQQLAGSLAKVAPYWPASLRSMYPPAPACSLTFSQGHRSILLIRKLISMEACSHDGFWTPHSILSV